MRGRTLPEQNLRGSDATLLEVQLPSMLGVPMGQIALVNTLDIFALSESEGAPKSLKSDLEGFVSRVTHQIADLPNDEPWDALVQDLQEVDPTRVPQSFREVLQAEIDKEERRAGGAEALLEAWSEAEPKPFEVGSKATKVTRKEAKKAPKSRSRKGIGKSSGRKSRGSSNPGKGMARPPKTNDPDRRRWVVDKVLERLDGRKDKGLAEPVLLAGIRHQAKDEYPDLQPYEILKVLKELKTSGRLRHSAGRWMRSSKSW